MKTFLSFLFFSICFISSSQDDLYYTPPTRQGSNPKRANTIVIHDTTSRDILFKQIITTLVEEGYGILNSDKETGTISTTNKPFRKGIIKLNILVQNQVATIRGDYNTQITIDLGYVQSEMGWSQVMNFGMKGSPNVVAWEEMKKFADQIPGTKEYLIK